MAETITPTMPDEDNLEPIIPEGEDNILEKDEEED